MCFIAVNQDETSGRLLESQVITITDHNGLITNSMSLKINPTTKGVGLYRGKSLPIDRIRV